MAIRVEEGGRLKTKEMMNALDTYVVTTEMTSNRRVEKKKHAEVTTKESE